MIDFKFLLGRKRKRNYFSAHVRFVFWKMKTEEMFLVLFHLLFYLKFHRRDRESLFWSISESIEIGRFMLQKEVKIVVYFFFSARNNGDWFESDVAKKKKILITRLQRSNHLRHVITLVANS